jgi:hypothetical protein
LLNSSMVEAYGEISLGSSITDLFRRLLRYALPRSEIVPPTSGSA